MPFRRKTRPCQRPIHRACADTGAFLHDGTTEENSPWLQAGTLHDAFIDELRDTYDAERQLTKALAKLAKAATSPASPGGL